MSKIVTSNSAFTTKSHFSLSNLSALCPSPGVGGWKDLLREDPRALGGFGNLRKRAEDQGSVQGRRHTREQQRDPHELAVHAFPSA